MPRRSMDVETFTRLVTEGLKKNPTCVYCKRNLRGLPLTDLMWMKSQRRVACSSCPEAFEVMTLPPVAGSVSQDGEE